MFFFVVVVVVVTINASSYLTPYNIYLNCWKLPLGEKEKRSNIGHEPVLDYGINTKWGFVFDLSLSN